MTKVMIVDDHPAVREGLAVRINAQPDMEVCGQAGDLAGAVKLLETVRPDVLIVDIQLETGNGLDLVERIKCRHEPIAVLVWSMYADSIYAQRALHAGALGYINKRHATGRIVEAIRRVREGKIFLCEESVEQFLNTAVGRRKQPGVAGVESLSDRELEVFRLIGQGLTTSQIAAQLQRSVNTVESHRQRIKDKLGLKTAGTLSRAAVQWELEHS
ncbi:MAG: response regulator transcription factor [Thermoguttaceae bacterium]